MQASEVLAPPHKARMTLLGKNEASEVSQGVATSATASGLISLTEATLEGRSRAKVRAVWGRKAETEASGRRNEAEGRTDAATSTPVRDVLFACRAVKRKSNAKGERNESNICPWGP